MTKVFSRRFVTSLISLFILTIMTSPPLVQPWLERTPTLTPTSVRPTVTPTPTPTPDPFARVPTATPLGHGSMILPLPTITPIPTRVVTEE